MLDRGKRRLQAEIKAGQRLKLAPEQAEQLGARGGQTPGAVPQTMPQGMPPTVPQAPGRRGDVFDPNQQPNAPGAPRTLGGNATASNAPIMTEEPVGAPGGRNAGAPLDLGSLSANASAAPVTAPPSNPAACWSDMIWRTRKERLAPDTPAAQGSGERMQKRQTLRMPPA